MCYAIINQPQVVQCSVLRTVHVLLHNNITVLLITNPVMIKTAHVCAHVCVISACPTNGMLTCDQFMWTV